MIIWFYHQIFLCVHSRQRFTLYLLRLTRLYISWLDDLLRLNICFLLCNGFLWSLHTLSWRLSIYFLLWFCWSTLNGSGRSRLSLLRLLWFNLLLFFVLHRLVFLRTELGDWLVFFFRSNEFIILRTLRFLSLRSLGFQISAIVTAFQRWFVYFFQSQLLGRDWHLSHSFFSFGIKVCTVILVLVIASRVDSICCSSLGFLDVFC